MTTTTKVLIPAQVMPIAQVTFYTAPSLTTAAIDKITATNTTGAAITVAVNIVTSGGTAAAGNLIVTRAIASGATYAFPELVGHVVGPGGFVSAIAGATGVNLRASGREIVAA